MEMADNLIIYKAKANESATQETNRSCTVFLLSRNHVGTQLHATVPNAHKHGYQKCVNIFTARYKTVSSQSSLVVSIFALSVAKQTAAVYTTFIFVSTNAG